MSCISSFGCGVSGTLFVPLTECSTSKLNNFSGFRPSFGCTSTIGYSLSTRSPHKKSSKSVRWVLFESRASGSRRFDLAFAERSLEPSSSLQFRLLCADLKFGVLRIWAISRLANSSSETEGVGKNTLLPVQFSSKPSHLVQKRIDSSSCRSDVSGSSSWPFKAGRIVCSDSGFDTR